MERFHFELSLPMSLGSAHTREAFYGLRVLDLGGPASGAQILALISCMLTAQHVESTVQSAFQLRPRLYDEWSIRPIVSKFRNVPVAEDFIVKAGKAIDAEGNVKKNASKATLEAFNEVDGLVAQGLEIISKVLRGRVGMVHKGLVCIDCATSDPHPKGRVIGSENQRSYVEPDCVQQVNAQLKVARKKQAAAVHEVLVDITEAARNVEHDLTKCFDLIVWADVAFACVRYGIWVDGNLALFSNVDLEQQNLRATYMGSTVDADVEDYTVRLRRVRHPLLYSRYLALKDAFASQQAALKAVYAQRQSLEGLPGVPRERDIIQPEDVVEPTPIEIQVKRTVRGVVITGPNTGGKTAVLKCLGLLSLMAKCAIPVPARPTVLLPWFQQVFADIGDEQSLTASLSTFSAHLARIQAILARQAGGSLLLLDEVGTGTDPREGGALGMALLQKVVGTGPGTCALVVATTHQSALTNLKFQDPRFENASVEFDEERLQPTYRMQWGVPGRSNAINIAARLGLQQGVVDRARTMWGSTQADIDQQVQALERLQLQQEQLAKAREQVSEERRTVEKELCDARLLLLQRRTQAQLATWQAARGALRAAQGAVQEFDRGEEERARRVRISEAEERARRERVAQIKQQTRQKVKRSPHPQSTSQDILQRAVAQGHISPDIDMLLAKFASQPFAPSTRPPAKSQPRKLRQAPQKPSTAPVKNPPPTRAPASP